MWKRKVKARFNDHAIEERKKYNFAWLIFPAIQVAEF